MTRRRRSTSGRAGWLCRATHRVYYPGRQLLSLVLSTLSLLWSHVDMFELRD